MGLAIVGDLVLINREVKAIRKDCHGKIRALCNAKKQWSPRYIDDVIEDIEQDRHSYYVNISGEPVNLSVAYGPDGKFLLAKPEVSETNFLNELPEN
jgi:hypothetical protein